jgi:cell division protein FtsW (lipid II flippase)
MLTSSQIERKQWQEAKAAGRDRFIWRQMLYVLVFGLILIPTLDLLAFKTNPLSTQNVVIDLILLPVFLLGGYLEGKWRWQDFEKKYSEDRLPPSE